MRLRSALSGLILGTATASCSFLLDFDQLEKGSGGKTISLDALPDALADALCKRLERCMGPSRIFVLQDDDCRILFSSSLRDSLFTGMPPLPKASFEYHPDLAQACVDAMASEACTVIYELPQQCKDAIEGKVPEGGDCTHPAECKRGDYCLITSGCPGKCTAKLDVGGACADGTPCREGLWCGQNTGLCTAPAQDAEACGGTDLPSCAIDHFCLGGSQTATGKCRPVSGNGGVFTGGSGFACDVDDGPLCGEGFHCELNSLAELNTTKQGQCKATVAADGPCSLAIPDECPPHQYCKYTNLGIDLTGTCTPLPEANQACASTVNSSTACKNGTHCDKATGLCQNIGTINSGCSDSTGCYSGYCNNGYCAPPNFCDVGDGG